PERIPPRKRIPLRRRPPSDRLQQPNMVLPQLFFPLLRDELPERLMIRPISLLPGPVRRLLQQEGPHGGEKILRRLAPCPPCHLAKDRSRQRLTRCAEHTKPRKHRCPRLRRQPAELLPDLLQERIKPSRQSLRAPLLRR